MIHRPMQREHPLRPRIVRASAELLAPAVGHYTFIPTASVYAHVEPGKPIDEDATLETLDDETREDYKSRAYRGLKVLCEHTVAHLMAGRTFIPRLSLVVGPRDPTDRFTYWPSRVVEARCSPSTVLAGPFIPFIDVRDAAEWIVASVEAGRTGTFNVGGRTPS